MSFDGDFALSRRELQYPRLRIEVLDLMIVPAPFRVQGSLGAF